jgi:hypothetical protein
MNEEKLKYMAGHVQAWAFQHLTSTTQIDRDTAMRAATDAANEWGRMLKLTLSESGVETTTK